MTQHNITDLLAIMAALRDPRTGCPWDLEQTFETIAPYTIEEAYEVAHAITRADMRGLRDELGDLLFQAVYHARLAEERGAFKFADVVAGVCDKMIRRHPHVFGLDAAGAGKIVDAAAQTEAWEAIKAREREAAGGVEPGSALDGVPVGLPAMTRAVKLQNRAARVGFDWGEVSPVLAKMREEIDELVHEVEVPERNAARVQEEFGDLLFVTANLARHLGIDPEHALRKANAKFERRFKAIEQRLHAKGLTASECTLGELDAQWEAVKAAETGGETP